MWHACGTQIVAGQRLEFVAPSGGITAARLAQLLHRINIRQSVVIKDE